MAAKNSERDERESFTGRVLQPNEVEGELLQPCTRDTAECDAMAPIL